jgi:ATP-dependent exoDNAse (exonuclease V) beta subunit
MEYRTSAEAKEGVKYDVVSNESLQLDRATSVVILINALRVLGNPLHLIAKAHLAYENQKLWPTQAFTNWNEIFSSVKEKSFAKWVPAAFVQQQHRLTSLPLFEMVENLILLFSLGKLTREIVYLQSFQDLILEFSQREKNDLTSFLEWWELNKQKKSVQVAGEVEAAQIITIHKAKGLQFNYVIIPFLNWEIGHGTKGPILWSKSDHLLFKDAGYIPIKYKKDLEQTFFNDDYIEEKKRIYLDNLNLLYVAFTRAEAGLIAFAPQPKKKSLGHIGQLVHQVLECNLTLQKYWSAGEQTFQMGQIVPSATKESMVRTTSLLNYLVTPWRERLQVRSSGMEFFQPTQQRKKINYGIFLHSILSKIRVPQDAALAIEHACQSGEIAETEREEIADLIQWTVNHPELSPLFSAQSICKMEAVLLTPVGEKRIDRIAMHDKQAWILDYKTGDPSPKDEEQVSEYMQLLKAMGKAEVTGYLVYVHEKRCVEVTI